MGWWAILKLVIQYLPTIISTIKEILALIDTYNDDKTKAEHKVTLAGVVKEDPSKLQEFLCFLRQDCKS